MTKKIRKRRANYFDNGGFQWDKSLSFGKNMSNAFDAGALNSAIGAVGSMVGQGISGGLSSGVGSAMQGLSSIAGAIPGPQGAILGAGLGIAGGLLNRTFGSQINEQAVQEARAANAQQGNMQFSISNTADLLNQANFGLLGSLKTSDIGKDGWFSNKAKNLTASLNAQRNIANQQSIANFGIAAENMDAQNDLNALANYAAYGGPLTMRYTGTMSPFGNTFADGGKIYIKPENRGKFTKYCGGKVTAECIARGKRSSDPAVRKRATFAANARKWHHAFGGDLLTHGAEWDNGLTIIGNGGTHEESPYEGVPMGMDAQGIPNLVEEGEVIFNDYVFSDRMNVPDSTRSSLGLSKSKNLTFAKAAKKLSKEAEERPNDPISKRGLMSSLTRLQQAQEIIREEKQASKEGRQYAHGGRMGTLFDGTGPESNYLDFYNNYLDNTYGKNPYPTFTGNVYAQDYRPEYTTVPDDNELLDIARVRLGEEPKGKVTPVLEPLINSSPNNTSNNSNLTWLRYAPVVGAAIGLGQNIFSKPDYSSSDTVFNAANDINNYTPIGFNPLGDYLTYRPFDRNYYINKLNAQSGATRRAIVNQSAGNRATALAGLLAADYNAQGKLGDLARQAEEYNLAQRERVATFNRGTNQFNSEMGLKAAMANQEAALKAKSQRLSGIAQAMQMRDAVNARRAASMSANLTNLFDSLGNIGIDEMNRADRDMLIRAGVFGTLSEKPQGWSNKRWEDYKRAISGNGYSRGGKLKKRRGGLTY